MQNSDIVPRNLYLSEKLGETWKRLRTIRRSIHTPFGRTGRYKVEVLPTHFRFHNRTPYESDRNDPPLSFASMEQIEKMNREIPGLFARSVDPAMDGAGDRRFSSSRSPPVAAVFVHAGAGYHSTTNEHIHLSACKE
jgi:taspase (threonine aspartase 1)